MKPLKGKIAVVAGATRGAGRGIACMLGEAGATVYCTGRSVRGKPSNLNRPETIEETAEMVTKFGGAGFWAQVDHTVEEQVKSFFERVKNEQGRLDILVNDVWGGDALTEWDKPFWELTVEKGRLMLDRAVNAHVITSRFGVPLMVEQNQGLIIEITDGDEAMNRQYRGNLFYDLSKISAMRLAFGMAQELRDHNITALAVTPGFLRSEMMLEHFGVTEANWRDAIKKDRYFAESETPFYVGRAVAALAADPSVWKKSGGTFSSWQLAEEYGFTDIDSRKPHFGKLMDEKFEKRRLELTECVRIEFEKHKLDAETILQHDRENLCLRARLSSDEPAEWFVYTLTFSEIVLGDLKKIAQNFYQQFELRR
jgi:NAD(P)-dependent dehydrogenase (short-subunit alcohol dehydrogenase family)